MQTEPGKLIPLELPIAERAQLVLEEPREAQRLRPQHLAKNTKLPLGEPRKMFGYEAFFVRGQMAVGLWQNTCVVKVSASDQAKLLKALRSHLHPRRAV